MRKWKRDERRRYRRGWEAKFETDLAEWARWQGNKRRAGRVFAGNSVFFEISWRRALTASGFSFLARVTRIYARVYHSTRPRASPPPTPIISIIPLSSPFVHEEARKKGGRGRGRGRGGEHNVEIWPILCDFVKKWRPSQTSIRGWIFFFFLSFSISFPIGGNCGIAWFLREKGLCAQEETLNRKLKSDWININNLF